MNVLFDRASESLLVRDLLLEAFPKFLEWFDWHEKKLLGQSIPCTFSYAKRTSRLNEQSCLDDYPRAVAVHERAEAHLDLQSQMIEFALTLQSYGKLLQGPDSAVYKETTQEMSRV